MGRTLLWIVVVAALGAGGWFVFGSTADDEAGSGYAEVDLADDDPEAAGAGPALEGAGAATRRGANDGPRPYAIRGRVVDQDGTSVPDVEVIARHDGRARDPNDPSSWMPTLEESIQAVIRRAEQTPDEQRPIVARTRADEHGRFELRVGSFARYRVQARPAAPAVGAYQAVSIHAGKEAIDTVLTVLAGTSLHGRVVDPQGRAVQASLYALHHGTVEGVYRSWMSAPVATDEDGTWRFDAVMRGSVRLTVQLASGLRVTGLRVETPRDEAFVIEIAGGDASVAGTVTDAAGTPVAGGLVVLQVATGRAEATEGPSPQVVVRATSGPDGRYTVAGLPAGRIARVEAVASGFLPYARHAANAGFEPIAVAGGQTSTHDIVLNRGGTVLGVVRAAGSGTPIPDATVALHRRQASSGPSAPSPPAVTTDADGRYRIEHVPRGTYVALASAEGYYLPQIEGARRNGMGFDVGRGGGGAPAALTVVMTAEGKEVARDLELGRGFTVEGTVVDTDGRAVGGAEVRARGTGLAQFAWSWGIGGRQEQALATSGADGRFTVRGLAPRDAWTLYARKEGFAGVYAQPFPLSAEATPKDLHLELVKGAILRGRVDGLAAAELANAQVGFWGQGQELAFQSFNNKVKPDGTFEITSVPPGDWTLNVWASGRQGAQKSVSGITAGEIREGIVLALAAGVDVTGRITDPDGQPVANLSLMLDPMGRGGWSSTSTDNDGRFHFRNVSKGGAQVVVWGPHGTQLRLGKRFQAPAIGLELTYARPASHRIRGEVQATDGTPIAVVNVRVTAANGANRSGLMPAPGVPGQGSREAINGTFELTVRGEGPWTIIAMNARAEDGSALNLRDARHVVKDPDARVIVRMAPGTRVAGRVLDEQGKGVPGVSVSAGSRAVKTGKDGRFTIEGLADADVVVQVAPPTGLVRPQPQTVRPGTMDLEFRLVPGLSIQGTALDPEGKPLAQGYASAMWPQTGATPQGSSGAQLEPSGAFELVGIPPNVRVRLQVQVWSASGAVAYAPAVVENVAPGTTGLEVRLGGGLTLEGTVLDHEGKPGGPCFIYGRSKDGTKQTGWVQVGEGGVFRLGGLDEVEYELRVTRQDGGAAPPPMRITPPASGIEIRLPKTTSLGGRIAGLGDETGQGWRVRVWTADGTQVASASATADGAWEVPAIAELGEVWVGASKLDDDRYARAGPMKSSASGVVLRLQAGTSIRGTVEGGVRDGRVYARVWSEGAGGWRGRGRVEADGSFVIRGLPPGTYVVTARTHGTGSRQAQVTDIRDGAAGVKLDLR